MAPAPKNISVPGPFCSCFLATGRVLSGGLQCQRIDKRPSSARPCHEWQAEVPVESTCRMQRFSDILISRCPDVPMSRCPDVPMSRCPDVPMSRCPDVPMSRCPDVPMSRCPDAPMPRCPDAPMPRCPDAPMPRCPDAPMPRCLRSPRFFAGPCVDALPVWRPVF